MFHKNISPKVYKRKPYKIIPSALKEDVEKYPDAYQFDRAERFDVSVVAICYALKRLGVTYKKNPASSKSKRRKTTYLPKENH